MRNSSSEVVVTVVSRYRSCLDMVVDTVVDRIGCETGLLVHVGPVVAVVPLEVVGLRPPDVPSTARVGVSSEGEKGDPVGVQKTEVDEGKCLECTSLAPELAREVVEGTVAITDEGTRREPENPESEEEEKLRWDASQESGVSNTGAPQRQEVQKWKEEGADSRGRDRESGPNRRADIPNRALYMDDVGA